MHFLSQQMEDYISQCSEPEPNILQELARETHLKVLRPRMITGHHQGRLLSFLSKLMYPEVILEIGTYTGYSALCLAEGLQPNGKLLTIDKNEELQEIQRRYFDRSPYGAQILQHTGMALEILATLNVRVDLAFVDAEKSEYPEYYEALLPKMRQGGIILFDNVLWSGKVLDPSEGTDRVTEILHRFNVNLPQDHRVETLLLPIRDGLTVCRVR
ncbi:O-methyltransferase [Robiginitalea sp.]|jgi:predicted O-methyltransferase YrrM|nr:O-methyltransferase [Robiginitalea sp.]